MKVDFHCHSTASDGTLRPAQIAALAEAASIQVLALTDHDNCDGIGELLHCNRSGTRFVAGVELDICPGNGFDRFHLLGIGIDPEDCSLKNFLSEMVRARCDRNERMTENFRRLGIEMVDVKGQGGKVRPIDAYANGQVLARPHFARWLVDNGYVSTLAEAFDRYLSSNAPAATRCYEKRTLPSQEAALAAVHNAGGLAVMAHPKYWRTNWKDLGVEFAAAERELARLKEAGLDGIEAIYGANTEEENTMFSRIADKFSLLKTAGSDFHGSNKPQIPLGMEVSPDYIEPFLSRLNLL